MSHTSSLAYDKKLTKPSQPFFPELPTANNLNEWHRTMAAHEEEGLQLLFEHYRSSISISGSQLDQMRQLALALARKHVPFFSSKRPKSSRWNIHEHAKFLVDVQAELKKLKDLGAAVRRAGSRLPKPLRTQSEKSLKRRYYLARDELSKLVSASLDGDLEPLGDTEAGLFRSFLKNDYYDLGTVRFEPCPEDPDAVVVSGLALDERESEASPRPASEK